MRAAPLVLLALVVAGCAAPGKPTLTLGTTTTTVDSGLLDALLPAFENDTSIHVRAVSGGSGEILAKGARGDLDVLLVHSRKAELQFVAAGDGTNRTPVMYNWFFLVGPKEDPAGVAGARNATDAFGRILQNRSTFASRGDKSGTDVKEKSLWPANASSFDHPWYKETGAGQGQTLLFADEQRAYALSDEATWRTLRANGQLGHLDVLFRDDPAALKNQYGVIPVNATRHAGVRADLAETFRAWIVGARGQAAIAAYRAGGAQVFFPDVDDPKA